MNSSRGSMGSRSMAYQSSGIHCATSIRRKASEPAPYWLKPVKAQKPCNATLILTFHPLAIFMKPFNSSSLRRIDLPLYLRSAAHFAGMVVSTLVICPLTLLSFAFPFTTRYGLAQQWVHFNLWTLKIFCNLDYHVSGIENIPQANGVILCKHQSAWETIALQAIFPPVVFILKRELLDIPFWGWAMRTQEPIAIDRSARAAALKQVLRDGATRLADGRWVVIFPEGTRMAPGQRGRYNGSGATLAHRAGCPVVPVAHNAGAYWGRKAFLKHPGTIQVRIGTPIDTASQSANDITRMAEDWIEQQMTEISRRVPNGSTTDC